MNLSFKQFSLLLLSLWGIYFLYFISSAGITCSNDGGHFGLTRAVVYDQELRVEKYVGNYVIYPDYAVKDSAIYSDRLPGNAMLMAPFMMYSRSLKWLNIDRLVQRFELDIIAVNLLPNLCGIMGLLLLLVWYVRDFGFEFRIAFLAVLVCGLCSLHWHESTLFFSHAPSMLLVTLAMVLTSRIHKIDAWEKQLYLICGLIGFSILIELQNVLFVIPIFWYVFSREKYARLKDKQTLIKVLLISGAIGSFFVLLLLGYNFAIYEEITLKSNKYNIFFPEEQSFLHSLSGDPLYGLDRLLVSFSNTRVWFDWMKGIRNDVPGLFVSAPVMMLSAIGYWHFYKKYKAEAVLFLTAILISLLIAAFHKTTLVRHIFTINMLAFFPFIFVLDDVIKKVRKGNLHPGSIVGHPDHLPLEYRTGIFY